MIFSGGLLPNGLSVLRQAKSSKFLTARGLRRGDASPRLRGVISVGPQIGHSAVKS